MEAKASRKLFFPLFIISAFLAVLVLATTSVAQVRVTTALGSAKPRGDEPPDPVLKPDPAAPAQIQQVQAPGQVPTVPIPNVLPAPALEQGEEGLAISLPAALRLANVSAWDIVIATQQLKIAAAQLESANVFWLPTLQTGFDYQYHTGPIQASDGTFTPQVDHSNMYVGEAPVALFALTDAIFTPLSARQEVRAQDANIQTARNDTLTNMALVYYDLLEAEADLAAVMDVDVRAGKLVDKAVELAPDYMPKVELARVRAAKANIEQLVETARQRWREASAEVARVARLKPTVVLQPLEPPQMRVTLVPLTLRPDDLIPVAVANRPELTFEQAEAEAARERLRQEKWRPFLPVVVARGGGTTPPDAMAIGVYAAGPGSDLNHFTLRNDWDLGAYWELRNMGLGNHALIRQRRAEYELALSQQYRFQDVVAKEVTQAWAEVRSADRRVESVSRELRQAELSAQQNLDSFPEIKRLGGGVNILVIRPLEVVVALQALASAYFDYYGVMADYNRSQFKLYRAIGSPAQALAGHDGLGGPPLPPEGAAPPAKPMQPPPQLMPPAIDLQKHEVPAKAPGQ